MGRADFRRAVHEVGEKRELPLDIAFVTAAIDEEHGVRIPTQSGQGFRFDVGHRSDLMPATIPK